MRKLIRKIIYWFRRLFGWDQLKDLAFVFGKFHEYQQKGLIHWQVKQKVLLIEESIAVSFLAQGSTAFRNFLNGACLWQNFHNMQDAYERHRIDTEAKAVREAKRTCATLTPADIQRIRQNARANMEQIEPDKLDVIREFDLFIIRATAPAASEATEANGQLLALGHYDGKTLEMAMYEDIKHNLQKD